MPGKASRISECILYSAGERLMNRTSFPEKKNALQAELRH
jgi:hypothetical protein